MKKFLIASVSLLLLVGCNLKNDLKNNLSHMNTELIVAFKDNITDKEKQDILNSVDASMVNDSGSTVVIDANSKTNDGEDICAILKQNEGVVDCVLNYTEEVVASSYNNYE